MCATFFMKCSVAAYVHTPLAIPYMHIYVNYWLIATIKAMA